MRIGLTGAHRSGKTTLATQLAEKLDLPLIRTDSSGAFEELGLNPKGPLSLKDRIQVQGLILQRTMSAWSESPNYVTDRTPIDFIAYMLSEITMGVEVDPDTDMRIATYLRMCQETWLNYFDGIIYVPPLPRPIDAPGKASASHAHIQHINSLILATIYHRPKTHADGIGAYGIPDDASTPDERLEAGLDAVSLIRMYKKSIRSPEQAVLLPDDRA